MNNMIGPSQWFMGAFGFILGARYFLGALLFPHWEILWNDKKVRRGKEPPLPMSVRGRLATGVYFAYWGIGALFCRSLYFSNLLVFWIIGLFGLMLLGSVTHSRDKRAYFGV